MSLVWPKLTQSIYRRLGQVPFSQLDQPISLPSSQPTTTRYKGPLWDPGAMTKMPFMSTASTTAPTVSTPSVTKSSTPSTTSVSPLQPKPTPPESAPSLPEPTPPPQPASTPSEPVPLPEPTRWRAPSLAEGGVMPTPRPVRTVEVPTWSRSYELPAPPRPTPPPQQTIPAPVPVEGVETPSQPAPETPAPEVPRGPGGFEREVPLPVGFSLPTPERLSELWQEVTGRPATEEERRYFESPQFLRVLTGRIPMWQAADPIWRRFFQLLGLIQKRLEE